MPDSTSVSYGEDNCTGEATVPYLDNKSSESRKTKNDCKVEIVGQKCRCGCVWCPQCFLSRCSKNIAERISLMNWASVRHIVLTIDPENFNQDPQKAYEVIVRDKKAVPQFCRDLQRTAGINVRDWVRVIEWHKNGFPHWHIFIDVEVVGKAGQIGHEVIQSYWEYGGVREYYIKTEKHFKELTGYFHKNGYFEKNKKHQGVLPDWALLSEYHIRRYDSKRCKKVKNVETSIDVQLETKNLPESSPQNPDNIKEDKKTWRGYAAAISDCGNSTFITLKNPVNRRDRFGIPYKDFKALDGEYVPGIGYVVSMWLSDFFDFSQKYPIQKHLKIGAQVN